MVAVEVQARAVEWPAPSGSDLLGFDRRQSTITEHNTPRQVACQALSHPDGRSCIWQLRLPEVSGEDAGTILSLNGLLVLYSPDLCASALPQSTSVRSLEPPATGMYVHCCGFTHV